MTTLLEQKDVYLAHFERLEKELGAGDPPWLRRIRKSAIARFQALGFPGPRNEDWRFTNLAALTKIPFDLAGADAEDGTSLAHLVGAGLDGPRLICVNGGFSPNLSALDGMPPGVIVTGLASALKNHAGRVEQHLARHAKYDDNALTALNSAFIRDGVFIYIPKGVVLEKPIQLVFLSSAAGQGTVSLPRVLIVAEPSSQATVVEHYVGPEDDIYFTNAVTEIVAGENSVVQHYKIQEESREAFHIANTQVVQARSSNFTSHYIAWGGRLVRNEVRVRLDGEGCETTLNGLYLGSERQHLDNFTVIDHAKPHCASHELYKGILRDQAHGVFNGKIYVRPDAQKTDAKQTNQVLLLSEDAVINTKPQLEIFADDVKCTHGATVGQLDTEAMFYLRSRGIGRQDAESLLTFAFANDLVSRIKIEALRERLERLITHRPEQARQDAP